MERGRGRGREGERERGREGGGRERERDQGQLIYNSLRSKTSGMRMETCLFFSPHKTKTNQNTKKSSPQIYYFTSSSPPSPSSSPPMQRDGLANQTGLTSQVYTHCAERGVEVAARMTKRRATCEEPNKYSRLIFSTQLTH